MRALDDRVERSTSWGWRIPFLLSIFLVGISLYIRLKMKESPIFAELKAQGKTSKTRSGMPSAAGTTGSASLISLFGATAGQGVVWYTGQFYALFYLQTILQVTEDRGPASSSPSRCCWACRSSSCSAALSDRIGRKKIMMTGCALAAVFYLPIYQAMQATRPSTGVVRCRLDDQARPSASAPWRPSDAAGEQVVASPTSAPNPNYASARPAGVRPGDLRHHGVRPDRGVPGGGVPGQGPLHLAVAPLPHRQRRLRRHAAAHRPVRRAPPPAASTPG